MEELVGEMGLGMDNFLGDFGARVHLTVRKGKGPRGSRGAEGADGFKQLFPSDIDA